MNFSKSMRPSPALIVAAIAMTFALVGTSVAADPVAKVSKNQVRTIAKKQIDKKAPSLSVAKAKTADSATSATSAVNAVNATFANNANTVGGLAVKKFSAKQAPGTALADAATFGGLVIRTGCEADGDPLVTATPAAGAPTQTIRFATTTNPAGNGLSTFSTIAVLDGTTGFGDGQIETLTTGGGVSTVQFAAREAGNFTPNENVCVVWGTGTTG